MINVDRTNQIKLEESNTNILVKLEKLEESKKELTDNLQRIKSKRI